MEDPYEIDPELALEELRNSSLQATADLIPLLMEKAINSRTKDTLAIFEALADRSGFFRQSPLPPQQQASQTLNLNFSPMDITQMLSGLSQITSHPASSLRSSQKEYIENSHIHSEAIDYIENGERSEPIPSRSEGMSPPERSEGQNKT